MAEKDEKRRRGPLHWLGCLLQVPLGCFAFLLGGTIVLIAFLPFAVGSVVSRWGAEEFTKQHVGSLEIEDAWLGSLYGDQGVRGVVIRDGDGAEVLHGSLTAPSFGSLFFGSDSSWGPIRLQLDLLDLRRVDGTVRLLEALRREELAEDSSHGARKSARLDLGSKPDAVRKSFLVELGVRRLVASDAAGRPFELRELEGRGTARLGPSEVESGRNELRFEGSGHALVDGDATRSVGLAWTVDVREESIGFQVSLDAARVEPRLLGALLPALALRPEFSPDALEVLHLRVGRAVAGRPLDLELSAKAPGVDLELAGLLYPDEARIDSGPAGQLRLSLDAGTPWSGHLLTELLPFVVPAPVTGSGAADPLLLDLSSYTLDLADPVLLTSAEGRLDAGLCSLAVSPDLRRALELRTSTRLVGPCEFRVRAGGVSYGLLRYDGDGGIVEVSGTRPLGGPEAGLLVRLPRGGLFEVVEAAGGLRLTPAR